jgi:hypothetical protein
MGCERNCRRRGTAGAVGNLVIRKLAPGENKCRPRVSLNAFIKLG